MQQKIEKIESIDLPIQNLKCIGGNKLSYFCTNKNCEESVILCANEQCPCRENKHLKCKLYFAKILFNDIKKRKEQIPKTVHEQLNYIEKIYNDKIQKLSEQRDNLQFFKRMYGIPKHSQIMLKMIIEGKQANIRGDNIQRIQRELSYKQSYKSSSIAEIKQFQQKDILQFNEKLHKIRQFYDNLDGVSYINSKIIKSSQKLQTLFQKNMSFELLYRASDNKFNTNQFSKSCEGIQNTLVLVHTQFGNIIGGYSALPFIDKQKKNECANLFGNPNESIKKPKNLIQLHPFMFSLTTGQKYSLKYGHQSITQQNNFSGPIFGFQSINIVFGQKQKFRDLEIPNLSNQKQCLSHFPTNYYYMNGVQTNPQILKQFCGSENGRFLTKEWEVFKVTEIQTYLENKD